MRDEKQLECNRGCIAGGNDGSLANAGDIFQATTPNIWPTIAVSSMAKAPQKVTRIAPITIEAPPVRAAMAPRAAKNSNEKTATIVIK